MLSPPLAALALVALTTAILLPTFGCRCVADYGYADPTEDTSVSPDTSVVQDMQVPPPDKMPPEETPPDSNGDPTDTTADQTADGPDAASDSTTLDGVTPPPDSSGPSDLLAPDTNACPCPSPAKPCSQVLPPTADGDGTVTRTGMVFYNYKLDDQKLHIGNSPMGESRAFIFFDPLVLPTTALIKKAVFHLCAKEGSKGDVPVYNIDPTNLTTAEPDKIFGATLATQIGTLSGNLNQNDNDTIVMTSQQNLNGFTAIKDAYANSRRLALMLTLKSALTTTSRTYYSAGNAGNACNGHAAPTLTIEYCIP